MDEPEIYPPLHPQDRFETDQTRFHYKEFIYHPNIPGLWTQRYAEQVARFVTSQPQSADILLKNRAIGQLIFSPDWSKNLDIQVLSDLHLAEAAARGVTPWHLQEVLFMQQDLYDEGLITNTHLVDQRDQVFQLIGEIDPNTSLNVVGEKVCGLKLCLSEVWMLNKISPQAAHQLQDIITQKFGADYYRAMVENDFAYNQQPNRFQQIATSQAQREIRDQADTVSREFLDKLSPDQKIELLKIARQATTTRLKNLISQYLLKTTEIISKISKKTNS